MDCTLKFMKEYDLRSVNNRATIMQDRGVGFGFGFWVCFFFFPGLVEEVKSLPGSCVAAVCSALLAGSCGHAELMIPKG